MKLCFLNKYVKTSVVENNLSVFILDVKKEFCKTFFEILSDIVTLITHQNISVYLFNPFTPGKIENFKF